MGGLSFTSVTHGSILSPRAMCVFRFLLQIFGFIKGVDEGWTTTVDFWRSLI